MLDWSRAARGSCVSAPRRVWARQRDLERADVDDVAAAVGGHRRRGEDVEFLETRGEGDKRSHTTGSKETKDLTTGSKETKDQTLAGEGSGSGGLVTTPDA